MFLPYSFNLSFSKVKSWWVSCGQSPLITRIKNLIPSRSTQCLVMLTHSPLEEGIAEKFWSINLAKHLGLEFRSVQRAHLILWPDPLRPSPHNPTCHHIHGAYGLLDLHTVSLIKLRKTKVMYLHTIFISAFCVFLL